MREPEEIPADAFLKKMLAERPNILPTAAFTANVMQAVEAEAARQQLLYKPLIPQRLWRRLGFAIGFMLLFPFVVGLITSASWSEWAHALTTFSLPDVLKITTESAATLGYLPKLAAIAGICLVILLLDKVYQRFNSR